MKEFFIWFFGITGVLVWICILIKITINTKKIRITSQYIDEIWCENCNKETKFEIKGTDFNEYWICTECEEIK